MWRPPGESTESSPVTSTQTQFKVGDKVRVDLEVEILKAMQDGHGGWNPRMAEVGTGSAVKAIPSFSQTPNMYYCNRVILSMPITV